MSQRRVLVTGASGFLGGYVVARLLADDWRPVCLVRPGSEARLPQDERVEPVAGDLLRPDDVRRAAEGTQAAIHLVGIIRETHDATFQAIHVDGTRHVVEACREAGIARLAHMSAHGADAHSAARYHQTKAAGEQLVRNCGLRWTVFRPSILLGPEGEFTRTMIDLVRPLWRPVPVLGNGQEIVQPVGVWEVADLMVRCLGIPQTEGRTYGLGGPEPVTLEGLLDELSLALHGRSRAKVHVPMALVRPALSLGEKVTNRLPVTREQLVMLAEATAVDIADAQRDFQWQPAGLAALVARCVSGRSDT